MNGNKEEPFGSGSCQETKKQNLNSHAAAATLNELLARCWFEELLLRLLRCTSLESF